MNIQQLEYIIAVDQYQHFGRAAEACFISQATLSAMIKKLEEELDVVIFDRKVHPILTTECGKEVVEQARQIVNQVRRLKEKALDLKNTIEGQLSIGIIPTVASGLLPLIAGYLSVKYPKWNIDYREMTTEAILSALKQGRIDAGIVSTPLFQDDIEEDILYYESLMVYSSRSTTSQYKLSEAIKTDRVWLLEEGHCLRHQMVNLCELNMSQDAPSNLHFEANSLESLIRMTDAFGGLTLLPELYVKGLEDTKKAFTHGFETDIPVREIGLVYHRPYAKLRLLQCLKTEIEVLVKRHLYTSQVAKSALKLLSPDILS